MNGFPATHTPREDNAGQRAKGTSPAEQTLPANAPPETQSPAAKHRTFKYPLLFTLIICVVLLVGWTAMRHLTRLPPSAFKVEHSQLIVSDFEGEPLWRLNFPEIDENWYHKPIAEDEAFGEQHGLFVNLDGQNLFLFVYQPKKHGGTTLYCFQSSGKVAWTRKPGRAVSTDAGETIVPAYDTSQIAVLRYPRADGGRIVLASHHAYSWVEHVSVLTSSGQQVAEYWHPGWLYKMILADLERDGREEIILGGVNDGYAGSGYGPALIVLDPDQVFGQSAALPENLRHKINGVPPANEEAVVLLPDFDRTHPDPNVFLRVAALGFTDGWLHVEVAADSGGSPKANYQFDRRLQIASITPDPHALMLVAPHLTGNESNQTAYRVLSRILFLRNRFVQAPDPVTSKRSARGHPWLCCN